MPRVLSPVRLMTIGRAGSVRLRATAAATLTVAMALGLASAGLLMVLQGSLESSTRADAAAKAKAAAATLKLQGPMSVSPSAPPGKPGDVQVLTSSTDGPVWKTGDGYVVAGEQVDADGRPLVVQARSSLAPTRRAIASLRSLLVPGVPALLSLVALLTWTAVGRALKPVSAIEGKMADITAHDLHERVPEPGSRDEIAALARTVNATLSRLQTAVEQHKRFVADAAHELRSPLAILRTRLELTAPGTQAEQLADQALTDVERIQRLTADLLLLARLDAGEPPYDQEVDLGQVVAEEAAQTRPRPEVRVGLDVATDVLVRGSEEQLKRLVANLVDNAVRHATTTVTVSLIAAGSQAVLEVIDDGPGIPPQYRETVFDRFTRLDQARDRDHGGSGLGLAIARDIATAHGGSLDVVPDRPTEHGACLRAVIPM
jgi:signal transduction histidine kinase